MAGEGRGPSMNMKSDGLYGGGGGGSSGCGTPRHPWRSVSWTARSREREAEAAGSSGGGAGSGATTTRVMMSMGGGPNRPHGAAGSSGGPSKSADSVSDSAESNFGSDRTQLLVPPLSSLSVSRNTEDPNGNNFDAHFPGGGAQQDERGKGKKAERRRNGLDIKLDLGAVRQVNFRENDAGEPSDTELSEKREKMALCEKQCSRIRPHLYFGSSVVAQDFEMLKSNKITHIINCVGYVCAEYFPNSFNYKVLWLQDSPSEDLFSILYDCFDVIEDVKEKGERVYVHCCQGVSRSAAIVIAYLMWRESRTFEDVFEDVKSLRSVTSPNMGFVFQLMNWQSRIQGSPKTPSLRMYRMAPHSPYDPLHQVPKGVASPGFAALDTRGAFVIQFANRLYVWQGGLCGPCMAKAADNFVFQLVRYERAPPLPNFAREGTGEPRELYEALANFCGNGDGDASNSPGSSFTRGEASGSNDGREGSIAESTTRDGGGYQAFASGKESSSSVLLNHAYDSDFEIFEKGKRGQVLESLPDASNLRGWDGRWNSPRYDILSSRIRR